jgi:hypothetical protein
MIALAVFRTLLFSDRPNASTSSIRFARSSASNRRSRNIAACASVQT